MHGKPSHRAAPETVSTFSVASSILNNKFRQRSQEAKLGTEAISSALRLELRDLAVAELRALPYLPAAELDARFDVQRTIGPDKWSLVEKRVRVATVALGMAPLAGIPQSTLLG